MNRSLTGKWLLFSLFLRLLREPMQSWMMKFWLNNHDQSEWPDFPVYQPDGARHVTRAEDHPPKEVIETMCSESFFTHHKYLYVESIQSSVAGAVDEDQYEFRETSNISLSLHQGSSVSYQSTRESLSTVDLSRDRSSKFGQGQQTVEQGRESIDYYYSYPAVEEMFCEERGCSMSQPEDASSDNEQYELCESPDRSCGSKFGRGKQTDEQEGELIESRDHYFSYPLVEEMFSDEGLDSLSPIEGEVSAHPQTKIVQTSYHEDEKEHDNRVVFPSFQPQEVCHPPETEEIYSFPGDYDISGNDEGGVEVEDGPRHELRLENNTVYRELDKTTEGYMPLSIEQRTEEQPCFITSDTKELSTPLPQNTGNDSSADCYSCVDLLVQGPHQGQDDERFSSGPTNSTEISQNMEYILKCDSNEDMACQKLLKDVDCFYQDIVQGMGKVSA